MVKPGGTGSASTDVISARLAPLPPRRSLSSIGGRGGVGSESKTDGIGAPCPGPPRRERSTAWSGPSRPGTSQASLLSPRLSLRRLATLKRPLTRGVTTPTTPSSYPVVLPTPLPPSPRTIATNFGCGVAVLLDLVLRRLGVPCPSPVVPHATHLALKDLFGLAHVVAHDSELVEREVLRDPSHFFGHRALEVLEAVC